MPWGAVQSSEIRKSVAKVAINREYAKSIMTFNLL
jgi:hypothetical protein